jgi:Zn-dependent protease
VSRRGPGATHVLGIAFRHDELRDLGVAWVTLSVAFAILFAGGGTGVMALLAGGEVLSLAGLFVASLLTAGVGFLLHELAHKIVAVRFGQAAMFKANYQMLGLSVLVSLAGFIYAAPGAVHHAGRITEREGGLIALAGPATNVGLGLCFLVPWLVAPTGSSLLLVAVYGVAINFLLAGFNMLPFGPLDGATVRAWSTGVYVLTAVPCVLLGVFGFLVI